MRPTNTYRGARRNFMRANKLTWADVNRFMPLKETLAAIRAKRRMSRVARKAAK